ARNGHGLFVQNWRRRWFVGQSARIIDDSIAAVPWEEHDEQQATPAPSSRKAASEPGNQATRGDSHLHSLRPRNCPRGHRAHRIPRKVKPVKRSRLEPSGLSSQLAECVTVTAAASFAGTLPCFRAVRPTALAARLAAVPILFT